MNGLIQSSFIYDLCQVDTVGFESVFFRSTFYEKPEPPAVAGE